MDLSCIISSGDLELYVLGMLPKEDAYKIEQLAVLFPEVRAELDRISESLEGFASTASATPSPSVKDSLMGKLKELKAEEDKDGNEEVSTTPVIPLTTREESTVVPLDGKYSRRSFWFAAAMTGFILSIGAVIFLASLNKQNKSEIVALNTKVNGLNQSVSSQQQQLQAYEQTMQLLHGQDYKQINLTSVPGKPDALAQVFWNTKTKEVFIADVSLPQKPANKQYQLWAIVDGKPVDAGLLSDVKNIAQRMKAFERADAFAITLENKGGSPSPTMEAMYVMAKVS